jgi:hypothetical protein
MLRGCANFGTECNVILDVAFIGIFIEFLACSLLPSEGRDRAPRSVSRSLAKLQGWGRGLLSFTVILSSLEG